MRVLRITVPVLALALTLCGQPAGAQPPGGVTHPPQQPGESSADWGSEIFQANCASCHGPNGAGATPDDPIKGVGDVSGYGPDLRGVGARAADFYLRTGRMPLAHPNEQPERGPPLFSDAEIRALVAYVASLGHGPGIPTPHPERGNLSSGLHLFTGNCAGCHQVVGEGGYVPGARVPALGQATPAEIAEAVRIGPYLMPSFSKKALGTRELDSIIAYVNASKQPDDRGGLGIGHIGPVPEGVVAWAVALTALIGLCMVIGKRARP